MEQIMEQLKALLGDFAPYAGIILVVATGSLVMAIVKSRQNKKGASDYLERYPDAAIIKPISKGVVANKTLTIFSVNGELPLYATGIGGTGVYAAPGKVELEVEFTTKRPGLLYKSVSKSTGVQTIEVEVEPKKTYTLSFDKNEGFVLKEENK